MNETTDELEARVLAYIANKSEVLSIDVDVACQFEDSNSEWSKGHRIGDIMASRYNARLNENETGRASTTTNYQPINNVVLVECISDVTIDTIIANPTYAGILGACKGDVFVTGMMNPRIKVIGFGHLVQGIEIGDYLDIKNVPGALNIRGIVAGGIDYEALHKYFSQRNPVTFAANAIAKAANKAWLGQDNAMKDLDDTTRPFSIVMKGIIEAHNVDGIYCNPNLCK